MSEVNISLSFDCPVKNSKVTITSNDDRVKAIFWPTDECIGEFVCPECNERHIFDFDIGIY